MLEPRSLKQVEYACACGNTQTVTFFPDEHILPATCCTKCRAGFNIDLGSMMAHRKGMFPRKEELITA